MPIKTAILGYGRSGSTLHADPLEGLPEFSVVAVCDIDKAALEAAGARFNCALYTDYKEMLVKETIDLVVIVTRSYQHSRMAADCLLAGVNVLVTKPWALNMTEAQMMVAAQKLSGKMLLPWMPARWGSDLLRLKEIINSGEIGRVFQIKRSEATFSVRNDWQTLSEFGGGYLLNWGPHLVDQPLQLVNSPVKSVYAELKQIINPGDVEDVVNVIMKTADDTTIISEFTLAAPGMPNWIIQGSKGTIFVYEDDIVVNVANLPDTLDDTAYRSPVKITTRHDAAGGISRITVGNRYGDSFVIYPHIARALAGQETYIGTVEGALTLTTLLDAARLSSKTGQVVFV